MNALFASALRLIRPWVSRWATVDLRGTVDLGALVAIFLLWAVLLGVLAFAA